MNDQTEKLLVVESDDILRATLITVLGDAGYRERRKLIRHGSSLQCLLFEEVV
jgi:hypothetical protein